MGDEGAQVLVAEGALGEAVAAVAVAGHDGHVLEVALAALVAHRAVVGMVGHQPLDDARAERPGLGVVDGDADAVVGRA